MMPSSRSRRAAPARALVVAFVASIVCEHSVAQRGPESRPVVTRAEAALFKPDDAAGKLIAAFQSGCASSGRWTEKALAHSQAMISVFQDLKNDDKCRPYASTLSVVEGLGTQLNALIKEPTYASYRQAEERLQELTLELQAAPAGSDLAAGLAQLIVATQLDLATTRASYQAGRDVANRDRFAQTSLQLSTLVQTMLKQSEGLTSCMQQHPGAAVQLATQLIGIGGSFVSPIFGAAASSVGQLVNIGIEYARTRTNENAIWKMHAAQMPLALSCGLEAMSELYCEASDAFRLLELQATAYPSPGAPATGVWRGLDLQGRRLPVLTDWLQSVKSGVRPTDPTEAERQNRIWRKINKLDEIHRGMFANLSYAQQQYKFAVGKPDVQQDILRNAIVKNSEALIRGSFDTSGGGGGENPFFEKTNDSRYYACWMVKSPTVSCPPMVTPEGHYEQIEEYVKNKLLADATFENLFVNWELVFTQVKELVDSEFAQTVTADPMALLAAAREGSAGNVSPRAAIDLLLAFLADMKRDMASANPELPPLIEETEIQLRDVAAILDENSRTSGPADRVRRIFDKFDLRRGLQAFNSRIGNFVQWELQYRLRNGELPGDVAEILRSAGGDVRRRLTESGVTNLGAVAMDLNKSRSLTERNVAAFREFFDDSIGRSIRSLRKAQLDAGEPASGPNRPNGQALAQLCTLALVTGSKWPSKADWRDCESAVLDSIYPDPQGKLTIRVAELARELQGKPLADRMCAYHSYLRAGRLAEAREGQAAFFKLP